MTTDLTNNRAMRDRVLARVRRALGVSGDRSAARIAADRYVAAHGHGPRVPITDSLPERFLRRATDMASTVEAISDRHVIPGAIARYLDALVLPPEIAMQKSRAGVCWPEFADLDWSGAGLQIEARPTEGSDRLGITGCFCAIAETGTLVLLSGAQTPTATAMLPDTHVAIVRRDRVVAGFEEAIALVRAQRNPTPRAIHLISGPSRTGDIEQTIVLGAHGPFRVHLLLVG